MQVQVCLQYNIIYDLIKRQYRSFTWYGFSNKFWVKMFQIKLTTLNKRKQKLYNWNQVFYMELVEREWYTCIYMYYDAH